MGICAGVLVSIFVVACGSIVSSGSSREQLPDRESLIETPYVSFNTDFYNPVVGTGADSWITFHDGMYYYTNSSSTYLFVISSPTISGLMGQGSYTKKRIFEASSKSLTQIWSPELHFYQGYWYCFFAASTNNVDKNHRIYILKSKTANAMGDWEFKGRLDLPPFDQKAIGPHLFEMDDGRLFLGFTGNVSLAAIDAGDKDEQLYLVELKKGDPATVISTDRTLISKPDYPWEKKGLHHNEGVTIIKSPAGTRYCIYSASWAGTDYYCLGMLKLAGNDPLAQGAWQKYSEPVLASSEENEVYGPGHASFTTSPDGTENWIIYHANKRNGVQWVRNTRAQKFEWKNDEPYFGDPVSLGEPQTLPSGETVDRILIHAEDMTLGEGCVVKELYGAKTVEFQTFEDAASAVVNVEQSGNYALYIRYRNITLQGDEIFVRVNNTRLVVAESGISGKNCTMTEIGLYLEKGKNLLSFSASKGIQINSIILDKTPIKLN